jgi:hypothetical protein
MSMRFEGPHRNSACTVSSQQAGSTYSFTANDVRPGYFEDGTAHYIQDWAKDAVRRLPD